jgi:hypothetical protein
MIKNGKMAEMIKKLLFPELNKNAVPIGTAFFQSIEAIYRIPF